MQKKITNFAAIKGCWRRYGPGGDVILGTKKCGRRQYLEVTQLGQILRSMVGGR